MVHMVRDRITVKMFFFFNLNLLVWEGGGSDHFKIDRPGTDVWSKKYRNYRRFAAEIQETRAKFHQFQKY